MEINLSERFQGMSPFSIRREKAREVLLLIRRMSVYNDKKAKSIDPVTGKNVIRRPAGDTWF